MKKTTALLLIIAMLFALVSGCAKKPEETDEALGGSTQTDDTGTAPQVQDDGVTAPQTGNDGQTSDPSSDSKPSSGTSQQKPSTPSNDADKNFETGDKDTDDLRNDSDQPGEVDTSFDDEPDEVQYVTTAPTSISDVSITKSQYDERNLKLPIMRINTLDGKDIDSKSEYKNATITIENTEDAYKLNSHGIELRGRGNSTWLYFDKKAYKIKFPMKTDVFGMGAAKKWVLLANAMDETMMRNYLAFSLAHSLGLEYTVDFKMVNVFINNEYQGVYIFCEQVQEGEERVNISTSKTGVVDTGYLLEAINNKEQVDYRTFQLTGANARKLGKDSFFRFIIKSPDNIECTDDQYKYISEYINNVNNAIFDHDWQKISSLIDVNSFVNMFLLDEVMLCNDAGYSFYSYKKAGGKLYLGPMWDFDQSCGNSLHGGSGYKGWYAGSELEWLTELIKLPEFKALVTARYNEKKNIIRGMLYETDNVINAYEFDFAMNNYIWGDFGNPQRWRTMPEIVALKTYKDNVIYLKTWLTNRMLWMEEQLGIE